MELSLISNIEAVIANFINDCNLVVESVEICNIPSKSKYLVFEGVQWLMLDENRLDQFPHVTCSKTGLENVAYLCRQFHVQSLDVYYVMRTYLTKHGSGPLPGECQKTFPDLTDIENPYQGSLRFADLNVNNLYYSIHLDLKRGRYLFANLTPALAVTCIDQNPMPDLESLNIPIRLVSHGPSRTDVHENRQIAFYLNSALKPISRANAVLRA